MCIDDDLLGQQRHPISTFAPNSQSSPSPDPEPDPDLDLNLPQDLYPSATSQRNSRTLPAACAMIRKDHMHAVLTGGVGPLPPFPYIDGPLFAVSAPLARARTAVRRPRRCFAARSLSRPSRRLRRSWGVSF